MSEPFNEMHSFVQTQQTDSNPGGGAVREADLWLEGDTFESKGQAEQPVNISSSDSLAFAAEVPLSKTFGQLKLPTDKQRASCTSAFLSL